MLRESETIATASDSLPPLGPRSDRAAAHYYRSMHARAVQREEHWKEKALAGEQIIKQLLVLVGWCVQQIEGFKRQLAWLKKQQFGSKSEATKTPDAVAEPAPATGSEQAVAPGAKQTAAPTKRGRGQQLGGKGPKRKRRPNLPQETTHHTLSAAERTCVAMRGSVGRIIAGDAHLTPALNRHQPRYKGNHVPSDGGKVDFNKRRGIQPDDEVLLRHEGGESCRGQAGYSDLDSIGRCVAGREGRDYRTTGRPMRKAETLRP